MNELPKCYNHLRNSFPNTESCEYGLISYIYFLQRYFINDICMSTNREREADEYIHAKVTVSAYALKGFM